MSEQQLAVRETIKSPFQGSFQISIKPDAEPKELFKALDDCFKGMEQVQRAGVEFYMATGTVLKAIRDRKAFKSVSNGFRGYLTTVVKPKYGVERATSYQMIRYVEVLEGAPRKELIGIPIRNLNIAVKKIANLSIQADSPVARKLLLEARDTPTDEFKATHGKSAHRGTGKAVIRIVTTHKFKKEFDRWLGEQDPEAALRRLMALPSE